MSVPLEPFTRREHEVWKLTAEGFSVKECAARLNISRGTLIKYRVSLYEKLGTDNAVKVALAAVAHGVIIVPLAHKPIVVKPERPYTRQAQLSV